MPKRDTEEYKARVRRKIKTALRHIALRKKAGTPGSSRPEREGARRDLFKNKYVDHPVYGRLRY